MVNSNNEEFKYRKKTLFLSGDTTSIFKGTCTTELWYKLIGLSGQVIKILPRLLEMSLINFSKKNLLWWSGREWFNNTSLLKIIVMITVTSAFEIKQAHMHKQMLNTEPTEFLLAERMVKFILGCYKLLFRLYSLLRCACFHLKWSYNSYHRW